MSDKREKMIERARKLLAMSNDVSSPAEAAIAMRRYRKIIDEYDISELDLTTVSETDMGTQFYGTGQKTMNKAHAILAVAVASISDVQVKWSRKNGTAALRFEGLLSDAVSATELHRYLAKVMYRQAERQATGRANRHAFRVGFATGVANQVKEILAERNQLKTSNGKGLVVQKQALIRQHFRPAKYTSKRGNFSGDSSAYHRGVETGKRTGLGRQVQGQSQGRLQ